MEKIEGLRQVVGPGAVLGEGPLWDEAGGVLWWLDIPGCALHRFDPATGDDDQIDLGDQVGAAVLRRSGGMVIATPNGFEAFDPSTGHREVLVNLIGGDPSLRMNDGKCDALGRFYAGSMAYDFTPGAASFYRLDADRTATRLLEDVTISNGLAWSSDGATLYWIDTMTHRIDAFDVDITSGTIDGRRPIVQIPAGDGMPDGMCIDAEGCLWVALYGGGGVHRYRTDGTLVARIEVPADQVTCCAFGGPDLGDLYITTAAQGLSEAQRSAEPLAGSLFCVRPGVAGTAPNAFAG